MKYSIYPILIFFGIIGCKQKSDYDSLKSKNTHETVVDYPPLSAERKARYTNAVQRMYDSILGKRGFNGGIIIAKNGEILLEDYRGYADLRLKDTITSSTPFHVASVSKTFTGMAIMKLWEEDKLKLEDSIQVYWPTFPYPGITIQMLLNHRSGLPNYVYAMPKDPIWKKRLATNQDMLQFLIQQKPTAYGYPNRGFHYCNTNYALLALIIEKITGQTFPDYMKDNVFTPLGMKNSFIFSIKDSSNYKPSFGWNNAPIRIEPMDAIYGDKNVYTTPRDLLLWDDALYSNKFVSEATLDEAIQPTSFEKPGTHNYGMGWRLMMLPNNEKIVYHNGWWHGNNSSFTRLINDTATIIIVGNKFNRAIYSGQKFSSIFNTDAGDEKLAE